MSLDQRRAPSGPRVQPSRGEYWYDPNLVPSGNGSQDHPFQTIQECIDTIASLAVPVGRVHVPPGFHTENLVVPQGAAVVIEGAVNGGALLTGTVAWTVSGSFITPGSFASALAFRQVAALGKLTVFDGSAPGINPLVYESCFIGEIEASATTAIIVPTVSGASNTSFLTSTPIVSSNAQGKINTKGFLIATNTKFDVTASELRCSRALLRGCQINQNIFVSDILSECYGGNWLNANPLVTFTGAAGNFDVDRYTRKRFMDAGGSVVNGLLRLVD